MVVHPLRHSPLQPPLRSVQTGHATKQQVEGCITVTVARNSNDKLFLTLYTLNTHGRPNPHPIRRCLLFFTARVVVVVLVLVEHNIVLRLAVAAEKESRGVAVRGCGRRAADRRNRCSDRSSRLPNGHIRRLEICHAVGAQARRTGWCASAAFKASAVREKRQGRGARHWGQVARMRSQLSRLPSTIRSSAHSLRFARSTTSQQLRMAELYGSGVQDARCCR